jgi:hypothetical protein
VSYRVRFEGAALVQLNGLPGAAFDALLQRVVDLAEEPWDAAVMPPGKDPAYRMTVSGPWRARSIFNRVGYRGRRG